MRNLMWAALATGCLLAGSGMVAASDTIRLGGPSAESAIQGGTDTELVRWRGGWGRGYYGRGYYAGYYGRGYYGGYYARPYYYPRAYAYYYSQPYYYPPTYCYPSAYSTNYYPIAGEAVPPPATTVQGNGYYQRSNQQPYVPPMLPPDDGTFQYDGGPRSPIPMPNPNQETNPARTPRGIIPIDGRLVSLPTEITGGVSLPFTHVPASTSVPRVTYPAYGEEPIVPAPRKASR